MKIYQLTIAACSAFFAVAGAFAQTPPSDTSLAANPVFQKDCAQCHGKTAGGRAFGGPSLVSQKTAGTSSGDLHNVIANGKGHFPKFRMPKFAGKLTSEEVDALVRQIQVLNGK